MGSRELAHANAVLTRARLLKAWGIFVLTAFAIGFGVFWWKFFAMAAAPSATPVATCVCPRDNGRPPSRQPTEDDYYSTPPGVSYRPR